MRYAVAASTEKMSEEDYYHKEKIQQVRYAGLCIDSAIMTHILRLYR